MILTSNLLIFLCYPMLVKLCLSMFKCPYIDKKPYLMADLQEPCYQGEHKLYMWLLTFPQLIMLASLPIIVLMLLRFNKKHLNEPSFRLRYGLLYRGYVKDREWWEVVIALRKILAVMIGTFGPIFGNISTQVAFALFLGFISIVLHLSGQPFGDPNGESKRLHYMELYSLLVIWCTYWGGSVLYANTNHGNVSLIITIFIIVLVCSYNITVLYMFGKALINAAVKERNARRTLLLAGDTQVIPVRNVTAEEQDEDGDTSSPTERFSTPQSISTRPRRSSVARIRSSRSQIVHDIHEEHRKSQINLDANIEMKARKQRRKTQLRVKARAKLKKQKVLTRIPAFATLTETEIDAMLRVMTREQHVKDEVLCKQGGVADTFYIVMNGACAAYGQKPGEAIKLLGTINKFQFFGEASLLSDPGTIDKRKATVKVESEVLTAMVLTKENFYRLIEDGKLNRNVLDGVKKVDLERQEQNMKCEEEEEEKEEEEEEEEMVPLERPKVLQVLPNLNGSKKRDERSLFS